jgi:hypothetical protein
MNWDQIETKWTAMTRRVRPDWPTGGQRAAPTSQDALVPMVDPTAHEVPGLIDGAALPPATLGKE